MKAAPDDFFKDMHERIQRKGSRSRRVGVQLAGLERGTECDPKIFWSRMDKSGSASKVTPGSCPVVWPFVNSAIPVDGSGNSGLTAGVLARTLWGSLENRRRFSGEPQKICS